jgi:hypothetical protein
MWAHQGSGVSSAPLCRLCSPLTLPVKGGSIVNDTLVAIGAGGVDRPGRHHRIPGRTLQAAARHRAGKINQIYVQDMDIVYVV